MVGQITLECRIGLGAFGMCYRGRCDALGEEVLAIKVLQSHGQPKSAMADLRENFMRELRVMSTLAAHPHIVQIKGAVEHPETMMLMEYMPLGALDSYLREHASECEPSVPVMLDMARQVTHTHTHTKKIWKKGKGKKACQNLDL